MAVSTEKIKTIVKQYGKDQNDTGSTSVQVAILTEKINALTNHLKENNKDFATKRTLYHLVSQRKSLLNYLKRKDIEQYRDLIKKLNLRS